MPRSFTKTSLGRLREQLRSPGDPDKPMTQVELAQLLGTTQATVARWEAGQYEPSGPAALLIQRLAAERGVTLPVTRKAAKKR